MKKEYFLGCSGWYYTDWAGKFYPEKLSKSKWLEYYSEHFNTVEVNNTFYRFPNEKTVQGWYNRTPEDFLLTLKVNQLITHRRRFKNTQSTINRFYRLSEILKDKLGCLLFQFPPSNSKDIDFLKNAIKQLDLSKNNVIEFRHQSWWNGEVYDILKENNVTFCSVSAYDFPDDLINTSENIYVRFHGVMPERYHYFYSKKELQDWAAKINDLNKKNIFCYFNNDYTANAPRNSQMLQKILNNPK
ncbi:uncharacterized protein YecE (DUF72 family) [Methanobacterium oryzae]